MKINRREALGLLLASAAAGSGCATTRSKSGAPGSQRPERALVIGAGMSSDGYRGPQSHRGSRCRLLAIRSR